MSTTAGEEVGGSEEVVEGGAGCGNSVRRQRSMDGRAWSGTSNNSQATAVSKVMRWSYRCTVPVCVSVRLMLRVWCIALLLRHSLTISPYQSTIHQNETRRVNITSLHASQYHKANNQCIIEDEWLSESECCRPVVLVHRPLWCHRCCGVVSLLRACSCSLHSCQPCSRWLWEQAAGRLISLSTQLIHPSTA